MLKRFIQKYLHSFGALNNFKSFFPLNYSYSIYMHWVFHRLIGQMWPGVCSVWIPQFKSGNEKLIWLMSRVFLMLVSLNLILLTRQDGFILATPVYLWDVSFNWDPEVSLAACFIDCWWQFISWVFNLCAWQNSGTVTGAVVLQQKKIRTTISCYKRNMEISFFFYVCRWELF